jgi:hypothetical protein
MNASTLSEVWRSRSSVVQFKETERDFCPSVVMAAPGGGSRQGIAQHLVRVFEDGGRAVRVLLIAPSD